MTDEDRRELERQADDVRSRMLARVDLLARRKAEVVKSIRHLRDLAGPLAWGTVLLTAGVVGVVASARRKRRSTRWTRPLATLVAPRPPSLVKRLGQRLLLLAAGAIAQRAIGRMMGDVTVPARRVAGRLPAGVGHRSPY